MVGSLEGRLWDRSSGEQSVAEDEDCLQGRAGRSVWAQRVPTGHTAQCSLGAFPTWASGCHHGTWVTEKSQGLGFLKHETSQTRRCSFLLGSHRTPQEEPTPAQEAEMGHSSSAAQSLLEIFNSLAFFFSPTGKNLKRSWLGSYFLSPAWKRRGRWPPC